MSDATPPPPQQNLGYQPPYTHPNPAAPEENEMTIVSHSNLFYWWPVWVISLILGVLTMFENHVVAVLPDGAEIARNADIKYTSKESNGAETSHNLPNQTVVFVAGDKKGADTVEKPHLRMTKNHTYGVVFTFVLLVVIFITNVPLRGMWSLFVIFLIAFLILLFAYFGLWDDVFRVMSALDIRFTEGGYFIIGFGLLVMWLVTFIFFDRQVYITVTPGNFKVCTEVGGGEKVYDTSGMQLEKHRSDLFRHWVLGLGSGDLTVHTAGAQQAHVELPNVLFIGRKVQQIENLIKKKSVVETR